MEFSCITIIFSFPDVPGPPDAPTVSDIDSTLMTVTWTTPSVDGGSPITGYILERKEKTATRWIKVTKEPVTEMTLIVKDLVESNEYEYHVAAVNKAGTGPFSKPSEPTKAKPPYGNLIHLKKILLKVFFIKIGSLERSTNYP